MSFDVQEWNKQFGATQIERCCGTCKHFTRIYSDSYCQNTENRTEYGEGPLVNEGYICPKWEKGKYDDGEE